MPVIAADGTMTINCDDIGAGGTEIKTKVPQIVLDHPDNWKFVWLDNKPAWHKAATDEWAFPDDAAPSKAVAIPTSAPKAASVPTVATSGGGYAPATAVYHPARVATPIGAPKSAELPVPRRQATSAAAPVFMPMPGASRVRPLAVAGAVAVMIGIGAAVWWLAEQ